MAVTVSMLETALGRDTESSEEADQWMMWVNDALMLIEARLGDPAELDQAKLDYVVREAVIAHIRHPDDATQVSVSVGDAGEQRSYRSAKGRVTILEEWWALLSPEDDGGAFTLDTAGTSSAHLPWCDLYFGGASCSCGVSIAGYPIYEMY